MRIRASFQRFVHEEGQIKNDATKSDPNFKAACELVKVEPTSRQARKWRAGRGLAGALK